MFMKDSSQPYFFLANHSIFNINSLTIFVFIFGRSPWYYASSDRKKKRYIRYSLDLFVFKKWRWRWRWRLLSWPFVQVGRMIRLCRAPQSFPSCPDSLPRYIDMIESTFVYKIVPNEIISSRGTDRFLCRSRRFHLRAHLYRRRSRHGICTLKEWRQQALIKK